MAEDKKDNQQQGDKKPQPQQPKKQLPDGLGEHIEKMQRPHPWPDPPKDKSDDK